MLTAVQFDDELGNETHKVADIEADLMLPPELEACQLTATSTAEKSLGVGRIFSQASGKSAHA